MKNLLVLFLTFCFWLPAVAQETGEFKTYSNGLIYSPATMDKLHKVVDSLQLKFKTCDLHKTYYAKKQAKGHYFRLEGKKTKELKKDLEKNISWSELTKKYEKLEIDSNLLLTSYIDKEEKELTIYGLIVEKGDNRRVEEKYKGKLPKSYTYFFDFWSYNKGSIKGFYITQDFATQPLITPYARMIQYTDCMVDTTTEVLYENAERKWWIECSQTDTLSNTYDKFDYPNKPMQPDYNTYYYEKWYNKPKDSIEQLRRDSTKSVIALYYRQKYLWDSLRNEEFRTKILETVEFQAQLKSFLPHAQQHRCSNDLIDRWLATYVSKEAVLEMKRKRRVVGGCSQDQSPRYHAVEIAMLAAETAKWEVFLRSHLNVMNDRFERVSDGSYAWGRRQTYIRELEELGINVTDLLLGICLRVENPSQNHYFGTIWRVGKALAETQNPDQVETKLLAMIADQELDTYNRLMMYYLFTNYNQYLADKVRQQQNESKLQTAVLSLPDFIKSRIVK